MVPGAARADLLLSQLSGRSSATGKLHVPSFFSGLVRTEVVVYQTAQSTHSATPRSTPLSVVCVQSDLTPRCMTLTRLGKHEKVPRDQRHAAQRREWSLAHTRSPASRCNLVERSLERRVCKHGSQSVPLSISPHVSPCLARAVVEKDQTSTISSR